MIVCSCNVLSDQDVRSAVEAERTRSTSQVYGCLGCSAQCGRCARTIRRLMDEALGTDEFNQKDYYCKPMRVPTPVSGDLSVDPIDRPRALAYRRAVTHE
jgi:bacterioferritin-associated ferredoxin